MHERKGIRDDDKAASRLAPQGRDGSFDLYVAMNGCNDWHDFESGLQSQKMAYKPTREWCQD